MRLLVLPLLLAPALPALSQQRRRGGPDKAPALGAPLPKVKALKSGGSQTVDLGKPKRHTVPVFGSYSFPISAKHSSLPLAITSPSLLIRMYSGT
jgi:hypothetical protein